MSNGGDSAVPASPPSAAEAEGKRLTGKRLIDGTDAAPDVTVILPVHNGEDFLEECFRSISAQDFEGTIEVSVFLDGCTDGSQQICDNWEKAWVASDRFTLVYSLGNLALGAGPARNRAMKQSRGKVFCIQDADDVMEPTRIREQLEALASHPDAIVGSKFTRIPEDATERYTKWCNSLTQDQLMLQRFRELTLIQPTWMFRREIWSRLGGYAEPTEANAALIGKNGLVMAEDMDFFYRHLDQQEPTKGKRLYLVERPLVKYRNVAGSASWRTPRRMLFQIKVKAMERTVLAPLKQFTIWGAGRDGKDFYKMLSEEGRAKVTMMCDIDEKKIKAGYHNKQLKTTVPVVHFSEAKPPIVCCVAMERGGDFERNLATLNLVEGVDYWHFT